MVPQTDRPANTSPAASFSLSACIIIDVIRSAIHSIVIAGRPLAVAAALIWLAAGCAAGGSRGSSAVPSEATRPLAECSAGQVEADIDALADVLPWAFKRVHWGPLHITNEHTALEAAALTPDDRTVTLTAQLAPPGRSNIQIRVGHFGDAKLEAHFLKELRAEAAERLARAKRKAEK